ncbi:MAG: hypothetical protein FWF52_02390 [Candidatus Azobacteroides sp.]|nr:hypothetical protein [Candidatus Azobacteroides sp.]
MATKDTEQLEKEKQGSGMQSGKKLSKAGQWRRKHPNGLEGLIINDRRILDG